MNTRIVALVDMDCFYCQVEAKINPSLKGKPMAVVQYNEWKGGGIIAVNYEARDKGVSRHMRGHEARKICPEIELVKVASVRGKADLTKYRDASREVFSVICEFSGCIQRASIDEAYIDLSEPVDKRLKLGQQVTKTQLSNTFIVGHSSKENNEEERAIGVTNWLEEVYDDELSESGDLQRLAIGALIVEEIREAIFKKTGFRCSAGIAHNKILAKLVAGLHKPNKQTVLPSAGINVLFSTLPVHKVRNLGGKFGNNVIEKLGCKVMGDLIKYSERELQSYFDEKTGSWLYNIARGIDLEPVTPRLISKSIGCCKQFRGAAALKMKKDVLHWLNELANEIAERLDEDAHMNKRKAQLLTISLQQYFNKKSSAISRSVALQSYEPDSIADIAYSAIKRLNTTPQSLDSWNPPLVFLGISAGKFNDDSGSSNKTINKYFQNNSNNSSVSGLVLEKTKENSLFEENREESTENIKNQEDNTNGKLQYKKSVENKSLLEKISVVDSNDCSNSFPSKQNNCIDYASLSGVNVNNLTDKMRNLEENSRDGTIQSISKTNVAKENVNKTKNLVSFFKNIKTKTDNLCISPSEIFPDLNNIDKEILSMLPLKLQEKVLDRAKVNSKSKKQLYLDDKSNDSCNSVNLNDNFFLSNQNFELLNPLNCKLINENVCVPGTSTVTESDSNNIDKNSSFSCDIFSSHLNQSNFKETDEGFVRKTSSSNCSIDKKLDDKNRDNIFEVISRNKHVENILNNHNNRNIDDLSCNVDNVEEDSCRSDLLESGNYKMCSYCDKIILIVDYQEHIDFHVAINLHEKLNSNQQQTSFNFQAKFIKERNVNLVKNENNKSPLKRKRGPKKKTEDNCKKPRSILSFFTPK